MKYDDFIQAVYIFVTRYIATGCLVSIVVWGVGSYFLTPKWEKTLRDAAIYLLVIGFLTLSLALKEVLGPIFWPPLAWFCFAMLLVMELFWMVFILDSIWRFIQKIKSMIGEQINDGKNERVDLPRE